MNHQSGSTRASRAGRRRARLDGGDPGGRLRLAGRAPRTARPRHHLCRDGRRGPRCVPEIWGDPRSLEVGSRASRTVGAHVSSLRGKLGDSAWIRTVRGVGFRLGRA
ncbi:winged helix-turn-helix domain-containing protein [Streptomyces sp. NPDC055400]